MYAWDLVAIAVSSTVVSFIAIDVTARVSHGHSAWQWGVLPVIVSMCLGGALTALFVHRLRKHPPQKR